MRSNKAPMTDVCTLIQSTKKYDSSRHYTEDDKGREIFCSVCDGVNRAEFYDALKAGVQLSAVFEIHEGDYAGETELCHAGKRYEIKRSYPTGYGTLELSCAEVIR